MFIQHDTYVWRLLQSLHGNRFTCQLIIGRHLRIPKEHVRKKAKNIRRSLLWCDTQIKCLGWHVFIFGFVCKDVKLWNHVFIYKDTSNKCSLWMHNHLSLILIPYYLWFIQIFMHIFGKNFILIWLTMHGCSRGMGDCLWSMKKSNKLNSILLDKPISFPILLKPKHSKTLNPKSRLNPFKIIICL